MAVSIRLATPDDAAAIASIYRQTLVNVVGGTARPKEAGMAVHEKLGVVRSGMERGVGFKLGEWVDVGRWQKDLAPRSAAPTEPVPFAVAGAQLPSAVLSQKRFS